MAIINKNLVQIPPMPAEGWRTVGPLQELEESVRYGAYLLVDQKTKIYIDLVYTNQPLVHIILRNLKSSRMKILHI